MVAPYLQLSYRKLLCPECQSAYHRHHTKGCSLACYHDFKDLPSYRGTNIWNRQKPKKYKNVVPRGKRPRYTFKAQPKIDPTSAFDLSPLAPLLNKR